MKKQGAEEAGESRIGFLPVLMFVLMVILAIAGLGIWDYERRAPYEAYYNEALAEPFLTKDPMEDFPPSYRKALSSLQAFAPAWTFEPLWLQDSWDLVLYEETKNEESNLVAYDDTEFYAPYKWMVKNDTVYDGANWFPATRDGVAYYMDPRNFFDLRTVFQFLTLDSGSQISSLEGVEDVFRDIPELLEFAPTVYEAGKEASYLAESLAIRMRQEISLTEGGISPLARGQVPLEGDSTAYYNFYNIGAYPDPAVPNGAQVNGARFARGDFIEKTDPAYEAYHLPWTSPESAIKGGAVYICNNYSTYGQDSLYLQKYDLLSGEYWHQYMQALTAPEEEAIRLSRILLESGGRQRPLVFKIPVFPDMPEDPMPWGGAKETEEN
jgi:beta-N-acetylglucosaminidase